MAAKRLIAFSAVAVAVSISTARAGPCSAEINRMEARVAAFLGARAGTGPSARESTDALVHRQPTPGSVAGAEEALGEIPAETIATARQGMERARAADSAGDRNTCERALEEVQRAIGP